MKPTKCLLFDIKYVDSGNGTVPKLGRCPMPVPVFGLQSVCGLTSLWRAESFVHLHLQFSLSFLPFWSFPWTHQVCKWSWNKFSETDSPLVWIEFCKTYVTFCSIIYIEQSGNTINNYIHYNIALSSKYCCRLLFSLLS